MPDIWTEALVGLQPRLGTETFDLWLRPLIYAGTQGSEVCVAAPSRFMKEWFENHYLAVVLEELRSKGSPDLTVRVDVVEPPPTSTPTTTPSAPSAPAVADPVAAEPAAALAAPPVGLSPRYRFDTFIKGGSNELAASAAWAAAQDPGRRFNPLFIYGGVGLGKTHLLHAVGHEIHARQPRARIAYVGAERFMNEFISAVRFNQFEEFRRRYREDCDVLLVDDIQFIAGRDRTMDEFFHVFNALYEAGKQIVVTADRVPADMAGMEERLTSRLNWGLVADVKTPDLETRAAIVRQKADQVGIALPESIAVQIASLVRTNVRELEGAFVRAVTFADLRGAPLDEAFVREALGVALGRPTAPGVSVDSIQKAVAGYFSLRVADLKGQRRHKGISRPRMIAMFLARELTGSSFPEIGLRFGGKDHSTVINACRRIDELAKSDIELRSTLETLRRRVAEMTPAASAADA
jgi:chromosomal replication initiator protein